MVHALAGNTGPWQMFHVDINQHLHPSVVFFALKMLRQNYYSEVLSTRTSSRIESEGVHAVSFSNRSKTKYSLWVTNSSDKQKLVNLSFVGHAGQTAKGIQSFLSSADINSTNREKYDTVVPQQSELEIYLDENGGGKIILPPNSIGVLNFSLVSKNH
jgi:hypothetical protein